VMLRGLLIEAIGLCTRVVAVGVSSGFGPGIGTRRARGVGCDGFKSTSILGNIALPSFVCEKPSVVSCQYPDRV
jgi:hypothetical protein